MTEAALVEGQVKLRDGKKVGAAAGAGRGGRGRRLTLSLSPQWKTRWLVLRKPSPVAGERARGAGAGSGAPRARSAAGGLLRAPGEVIATVILKIRIPFTVQCEICNMYYSQPVF